MLISELTDLTVGELCDKLRDNLILQDKIQKEYVRASSLDERMIQAKADERLIRYKLAVTTGVG